MNPYRRILGRSSILIVSLAIPLVCSFVVVSLAMYLGRTDVAAILGMIATVVGLSIVLNAGLGVVTLRELGMARRSSGSEDMTSYADVLLRQFRIGTCFSLFSVAAGFIIVATVSANLTTSSTALWVAFALQIPTLLLSPHDNILAFTFQHLDRDRENLRDSVLRNLLILAIAVAGIAFLPNPVLAAASYSAAQCVGTFVSFFRRRARLAKLGLPLYGWFRPECSWTDIGTRLGVAIDGVVFMCIFSIAQVVATSISLQVGAQVAVCVSFTRMIILPLKQVGNVSGRLALQQDGERDALPIVPALVFLVPALALVLGMSFFGGEASFGPVLGALIAAPLMIEPLSGVLYAHLKLVRGARAGLASLLLAYAVVAPVGLGLAVALMPTAVGIWLALLAARIVFAAGNLRVLLRSRMPAPEGNHTLRR